jgi:thiamine-monophosphate kinase
MFTNQRNDSIRSLGEVRLIAQIREWLGDVVPPCPEGMGDDCAVVEPLPGKQILTTDSLSYGQHFDDKVSPQDAGAKLVKRNLSDIAAMGGKPGHALLTLLCGSDLRIDWLRAFIRGIRSTCEIYKVALVGGDVSTLPDGQFVSSMSLTGYLEHPPLLRSGGCEGDALYVTGSLGGSLRQKHFRFDPRLAEGRWLAVSGHCSALMDLTDGLAKDLRELIPKGCAAYLDLDDVPVSEDAHRIAAETGLPAMAHAFCDGEDHELLFAVQSTCDLKTFERAWAAAFPQTSLSRIGRIGQSDGNAPYLNAATGEALPWIQGFEHVQ